MRAGRDGDPNIYREYTDSGREFVVTRERYENDLRLPETEGILQIDRQPGIRASIGYDSENWSFWSSPITESGTWLDLRNGSHLQLQITLQSRAFGDWVELDSLWIETSPPLADQIVGEVARAADLQPGPGFVQVDLGARETFVYDLRASFASAAEGGFDRVRIHTGIAPRVCALGNGRSARDRRTAGCGRRRRELGGAPATKSDCRVQRSAAGGLCCGSLCSCDDLHWRGADRGREPAATAD